MVLLISYLEAYSVKNDTLTKQEKENKIKEQEKMAAKRKREIKQKKERKKARNKSKELKLFVFHPFHQRLTLNKHKDWKDISTSPW